jgi:hypothetical protein
MAGYIIYSLDWNKFQSFVNNPTPKQLLAFAEIVSKGFGDDDDAFEEGDPVRDWPREPEELCDLVKERLARPDWYGDLSNAGKSIWAAAVDGFCQHTGAKTVGFRVDHNGIYWDVLQLARQHFNLGPDEISPNVALSTFGKCPYRYHPASDAAAMGTSAPGGEEDDEDEDYYGDYGDDWAMHSMHTPEEVRKMLDELRSVGLAIEKSRDKQAIDDYDFLLPVLEKLDSERRMLFVKVDT